MTVAIFVVMGVCASFLCLVLVLGIRASWKVQKDAGWIRRGLFWIRPLRDTLAPWKDASWAQDLEEPEFREDPPESRR